MPCPAPKRMPQRLSQSPPARLLPKWMLGKPLPPGGSLMRGCCHLQQCPAPSVQDGVAVRRRRGPMASLCICWQLQRPVCSVTFGRIQTSAGNGAQQPAAAAPAAVRLLRGASRTPTGEEPEHGRPAHGVSESRAAASEVWADSKKAEVAAVPKPSPAMNLHRSRVQQLQRPVQASVHRVEPSVQQLQRQVQAVVHSEKNRLIPCRGRVKGVS